MSSNQNTRRARHLARLARVLVFGGIAAVGFASMADAAPAGVKAQVKRNVLTVTGTSGADNIRVRLKPFDSTKLEVDVGGNGTADFTFNRSQFTSIEVLGAGGDDTIVAVHINGAFTDTEETTFDGGPGNDTLSGSVGNDRFIGGTGNDTVDGDLGMDTVMLGDGTDTFVWVFGDASDVVAGGAGTDTMWFTGANIGETFDVTANGGKVRLARNVGTVVMDIDDLEVIQLNAMSGPDIINVGNLAGTDLTTLDTNLGGLGGADDTSADSINVPLNAAIGRDGSTPVANGLGAQVRVSFPGQLDEFHVTGGGASDTFTLMGTSGADSLAATAFGTDVVLDGATPGMFIHLTGIETTDVQLGAGNDTFSAVGNLAPLTTLLVDGGNDNDTLLGGNGADQLTGGSGNDFLDGQQGVDSIAMGDGDDIFQWDPGDGSDASIDGGTGADAMAFNGSGADEIFDVRANGSQVRFSRNIANIQFDFDNIEALNLNTLFGSDTVLVQDLTGTDLTTLSPNMAGFGGSDDAANDTIEVPVGVTIGRDGTTPIVNGLGAQVRVANPFPLDEIHVTGPSTDDAVTIAGTDGPDTIQVAPAGTDIYVDGATPGIFVRLTGIETTDVALAAGNDTFGAAGNLAPLTTLRVDGGNDGDILLGGNGADQLVGGQGDDFIDGNQGSDAIVMGDGTDTFQWDPGDGSDTVDGGAGADTMLFNGSAANEIYNVVNNGGAARFTRNIASVVTDLDNLEAITVNALSGSDIIMVNNLTGTDVTTFTANLAGNAGVDDLSVDTVELPAGVDFGRDGSTPIVNGLGAQVRIVNPFALDEFHVVGPTVADTMTINGTDGADTIAAYASGTDVVIDGVTPGIFIRLTGFEVTEVMLGAGNDTFAAVGNLAALTSIRTYGGADHDSLIGGNGNDYLDGGPGNDFLDGNQGLDTVAMGDGADTFQWDPGDSNDTVDGGDGSDTMVFNGSAIGEILELSNNSGHVRFTRNIASIVTDLDNVESFRLNALAGNDSIIVNSLVGTDVASVNVNLSNFIGGSSGDVTADGVWVYGSAGDDTITIGPDGSSVVVTGVGPTVRVTGADPTLDSLTVDGGGGANTINPVPGVESLILLTF